MTCQIDDNNDIYIMEVTILYQKRYDYKLKVGDFSCYLFGLFAPLMDT